ncbi:MAG: TPM domain-containing protein [Melioribacteraceae bacterium]|jgi:uncharacterized membrane protein|nr:TPM domain-containing protein [Melioribacteraceae bacterium]
MEPIIYTYFSDDDFLRISKKITENEKYTSGEIRIAIREKRKFSEKKQDIRKIAETEFFHLKMNETRDKTGILLFILLSEKTFYILADEGINSKVEQNTWDIIRDEILAEFKLGRYCDGVLFGIEKIGKILSQHFPIKQDDSNELSNKVVIN